jgi:ribose 5-phosphate isomerase B
MIYIGSDHRGLVHKNTITDYLFKTRNHYIDNSQADDKPVDYPDIAHKLCSEMKPEKDLGILICGTGNGMCMVANRYPNIRAGIAWSTEIAEKIRLHNDANVICLPADYLSIEETIDIIKVFMSIKFEGGRHQKRIDKINISLLPKDADTNWAAKQGKLSDRDLISSASPRVGVNTGPLRNPWVKLKDTLESISVTEPSKDAYNEIQDDNKWSGIDSMLNDMQSAKVNGIQTIGTKLGGQYELRSSPLVPKNTASQWSTCINPDGENIGLNTIHSKMGGNRDLRSDPPMPKVIVSPWAKSKQYTNTEY